MGGALPPVEKLPLAVRKNVRDEFDSKKPELEAKLKEILGVEWTVDVNPNAIFPYCTDESGKSQLGRYIYGYINDAIGQIKYEIDREDEEGAAEINKIAHAHVLTLAFDPEKRNSYCGAEIVDGKIQLLFSEGQFGTNSGYALDREHLYDAFNAAKAPEGTSMSFKVRQSIRRFWDKEIGDILKECNELLERKDDPLTFDPNWEDTYNKLQAESQRKKTELPKNWEERVGYTVAEYFKGFHWGLKKIKVDDDDMVREGVNEGLEKKIVKFRIVEKLAKSNYSECVFEDGVLYVQTTPVGYGSNVNYCCDELINLL